jgi:hypothetical protein
MNHAPRIYKDVYAAEADRNQRLIRWFKKLSAKQQDQLRADHAKYGKGRRWLYEETYQAIVAAREAK